MRLLRELGAAVSISHFMTLSLNPSIQPFFGLKPTPAAQAGNCLLLRRPTEMLICAVSIWNKDQQGRLSSNHKWIQGCGWQAGHHCTL